MIDRPFYLERLATALRRSPITALLGPRQCGKTTLARLLVLGMVEPDELISGKDYTGKSGVGGYGFPSLDKEGWRVAPGWFDPPVYPQL